MNSIYKVTPTSQKGQSLLVSTKTYGGNPNMPVMSLQMTTERAKQIAKAVNAHDELVELCRILKSKLPYGNEALKIKADDFLKRI